MSFVPTKDSSDAVRNIDTFQRTEGASTVETQAVAVVDPSLGTPIDFATQLTLAEVAGLIGTTNSKLSNIQTNELDSIKANTYNASVSAAATKNAVDQVKAAIDANSGGLLTDYALRQSPLEVNVGTVPVTGTFWQATQPVSGPITDAQLRASAVPTVDAAGNALLTSLAGTITTVDAVAGATPTGQLVIGIRQDAETSPVSATGDFHPFVFNDGGRLKVSVTPADIASTSGSIKANGQNVSLQVKRLSNLAISMVATTLVGHNATFEASNNSTNGTDGNWYAVQVVRSNANTVETATGVLATTPAYMWQVNVSDYGYFRIRATAHTSGTAAYILNPSAYVSEPIPAVQVSGTQPVSGTVTATVTAGTVNPVVPATPYFMNSLATTNGALILTGTSGVHALYATNTGAAVAFVKLYNKATAPTVGTDIPEMIIPLPAAVSGVPGVAELKPGFAAYRFALGLGIAITGAVADSDTTAVAAGQVKVKISRTV